MTIAVTEEQRALRDSVVRWAEDRKVRPAARDAFEAAEDALPTWWADAGAQGWLGLHLPEAVGGSGATLVELAVVLEELARAGAPGPFLPTALAATLIARAAEQAGQPHQPPLRDLLAGLADGRTVGAVALEAGTVRIAGDRLSGDAGLVLGASVADVLVIAARPAGTGRDDGGAEEGAPERWLVLPRHAADVRQVANLDGSRRVARVHLDDVALADAVELPGLDRAAVRDLAVTLGAAEAAGVAAWCQETATAHAKVREQFGRPIGCFQAVKHACADMLARAEEARAAAWDAAHAAAEPAQHPLSAAIAGAIALDAAVANAKSCIQVHGGIGYTWAHDAHLALRHALSLRQLLGSTAGWRQRTAELALAGARRALELQLPPEAEAYRTAVRAVIAEAQGQGADAQRRLLARSGYLVPHWPAPYGRDAGAVEQLVIAQELKAAGIRPPALVMGDWVLPTLISYGDEAQKARFVGPTLDGDLTWCQLFSEPGAGSDLASLQTRATRVDGGWSITGQKVWNSLAASADWAICLARTNPDAPKHEGITYFLVDMRTEGIDVRPLRELTGHSMFNEVFLTDVVVPDDCVVGEVDGGWPLARNTLANERVAMSGGSGFGSGVDQLLALLAAADDAPAPDLLDRVGHLAARGQVLTLLAHRTTLRAVEGVAPGPSASIRKLLSGIHQQDAAELGLELQGAAGATLEDGGAVFGMQVLVLRAMTIVGGTTEIQKNLIGERILGLPRDDAR
jgi:alkylation response protein AidB-like acyl-CoA dehydrogenase